MGWMVVKSRKDQSVNGWAVTYAVVNAMGSIEARVSFISLDKERRPIAGDRAPQRVSMDVT